MAAKGVSRPIMFEITFSISENFAGAAKAGLMTDFTTNNVAEKTANSPALVLNLRNLDVPRYDFDTKECFDKYDKRI